ncbi:MAG: NAD-dependent epimerase/dehydratase family protein [Candidatus Eisenbacteria bacterium]
MTAAERDATLRERLSDRAVLITGGLGFIGSTLAHRLVALGARVTLVDSMVPQYGGNPFNIAGIETQVRVNISDVRDPHSMATLIRDQDFLFNLAGQTSHLDSMEDPETDLEINCRAQLSILEACRRHNPGVVVVFASTRQIYGRPEYLPVDEKHRLRPVDVNGINKIAGESYHLVYHDVYGIRASSLRLTNTIGPRMRVKDARQTFLGIWVRLLLEGRPFEVWEGAQLRDFTDVDDCVEALLLAATRKEAAGQFYNLGGGEAVSLKDLATRLVTAAGQGEFAVKSFPAERKRIDIGDYYSDWSRIRDTLGWSPRIALDDTLRRTVDYYRQHLGHYL